MDFYQNGPTTLHDLQPERKGHARSLVAKHAAKRNSALVLPMLYSEMQRPAMPGLRKGLEKVDYLNEVLIALTASNEEEVEHVRQYFNDLPANVRVLWCEGPQTREVLESLADKGFDLRSLGGKGLAVWLGIGAASENNDALVLHDADIQNYNPRIVHRLLLPILVPEMDFFFAKGYYARITNDQLYGRAVRLFVWPFLDALSVTLPQPSPFIQYLRSFRYPLSGEMAMTSDLARNLRIPTDWGLELGILGEVHRNTSSKRICQTDLGLYSHKHQKVGSSSSEGLGRMAFDIACTLFRLIAAEGSRISHEFMVTLQVAYRREAQDAIRKYHMESIANGLEYDRHNEEMTVEFFEPLIAEAGERFLSSPNQQLIGEWLRALSADPDSPSKLVPGLRVPVRGEDRLREAIASDTASIN